MNEADNAAAVAAAPAVRHRLIRPISRCQVSKPALSGNSHTAAATELSVKAVVGAAAVSCASTAASAWNVVG